MFHKTILENEYVIRTATSADAIQMAYVQTHCYPSLHQSEIMNKDHFANQCAIFPEGQLVIEKDKMIVASASTFRCNFPKHDSTFLEETDNLWITNVHQPNGDWMYGIDMGVFQSTEG